MGYIVHSGGDEGVGTWMYFDKENKTGKPKTDQSRH